MRKKTVPKNNVNKACAWAGIRRVRRNLDEFEASAFETDVHPSLDLSRWSWEGTCLTFRVDERSVLYFLFDGPSKMASIFQVTLSSVLADGDVMNIVLSDFPGGDVVARALFGDTDACDGVITALSWRRRHE